MKKHFLNDGDSYVAKYSLVSVAELIKFIAEHDINSYIGFSNGQHNGCTILSSYKEVSKEVYEKEMAKLQIDQFKIYKRHSKDHPNDPAPEGYAEWLAEETEKKIAKLEIALLKSKKLT